MARTTHKLNDATIRNLFDRGFYSDGSGLYLQVGRNGTKSWVFRFSLNGRARDMGLGSLREVTLAQARTRAAEARLFRAQGIDPIEARMAAAQLAEPVENVRPLFRDYAEECIDGWAPDWKNQKLAGLWRSTLNAYAYPVIGDLPLDSIETKHIIEILKPIWREKSETASRVRVRIERVPTRHRKHRGRDNGCKILGTKIGLTI